MNKKKKIIIILVIILVISIIALGTILYFSYKNSGESGGTYIKNPVIDLTDEQAVQYFNESFVRYLLYAIDADELHNPPLGSDTPKITIHVENKIYNAEVKKHVIYISTGTIPGEDIRIITTRQEAVKMLRDKNYVKTSFENGASTIEIVSGEAKLLAKGYLGLYNELTGDS